VDARSFSVLLGCTSWRKAAESHICQKRTDMGHLNRSFKGEPWEGRLPSKIGIHGRRGRSTRKSVRPPDHARLMKYLSPNRLQVALTLGRDVLKAGVDVNSDTFLTRRRSINIFTSRAGDNSFSTALLPHPMIGSRESAAFS